MGIEILVTWRKIGPYRIKASRKPRDIFRRLDLPGRTASDPGGPITRTISHHHTAETKPPATDTGEMIDFIKLGNLAIGLKIKDHISFPMAVEEGTGEVLKCKQSAKIGNDSLIFTITPGPEPIVKVRGSLHKYANNGIHNADRFTLSRFSEIADQLAPILSPGDPVRHIEFGININTPFEPAELIRNLIEYKGKRFNLNDIPGELFAWANFSQYQLKIYDKGLQYGKDRTLRLELKYRKMENLYPDGLKWADLRLPETWQYLSSKLIESFENTTYFDPTIDLTAIQSTRIRELLEKGNNPFFWENNKNPNRGRTRERFKRAVRKSGSTFASLPDLIEEEVSLLIDLPAIQKVMKSDHFSIQLNDTSISGNYQEVMKSDPLLYGQFSSPYQSAPSATPKKLCPITGIDITTQKPESRFLGPTRLKELLATNPEKFEELKRQRLTSRMQSAPLAKQIVEIAHSVRNEYNNPKHNARRDIGRVLRDPALFDQRPFINKDRLNLMDRG